MSLDLTSSKRSEPSARRWIYMLVVPEGEVIDATVSIRKSPNLKGKVKDVELKGHTDCVDQLSWDPKHADLLDARIGKFSLQTELCGEDINITYKPDGTHIGVGNSQG